MRVLGCVHGVANRSCRGLQGPQTLAQRQKIAAREFTDFLVITVVYYNTGDGFVFSTISVMTVVFYNIGDSFMFTTILAMALCLL